MGNGAAMTNRILLMSNNNNSQANAPTAFEQFGISAKYMADNYDHMQNRKIDQYDTRTAVNSQRPMSLGSSVQDNNWFPKNMVGTADSGITTVHRRFNTLTQKNEQTQRPGIQAGLENALSQLERNYSAENEKPKKKELERDLTFQKEMFDCINIMQRMPAYKKKVWEKISVMHSEFEEQKGEMGIMYGDLARKRLA